MKDFFTRAYEILFSGTRGGALLEGYLNTLLITAGAIVIGIIGGTILAVFKVMPQNNRLAKILAKFADAYIALFRGTPVLVQLAVFYFIIFAGIGMDPLLIAIIGFGFNSSAYVAEIMRAGISSVDVGQFEAGRAVGLGYATTMFKVIIPQAIKNIIPSLGNELIVLVKETSVASVITITDFFNACRYITSKSYNFQIPYLFAAVVYLVTVYVLAFLIKLIERRLKKSERRR